MKHLNVNEVVDNGIILEANRQFFHPLGLALELFFEDGKDEAMFRLQDHRVDDEGNNSTIYFGEDDLEINKERIEKIKKFDTIREDHERQREGMLGYIIQKFSVK